MPTSPDAIVVGSGPNGLAAAITLARAGRSVRVLEAQPTLGGGVRSAGLTLPGFIHDLGSAIHPLGFGSPFFNTLPLERHGLRWIQPEIAVAHPFDDGTAAALHPSLDRTCDALGEPTARHTASSCRPWSSGGRRSPPNFSSRCCTSRGTLSCWRASDWPRCNRRRSCPGGCSGTNPRAGCSPDWPRTRSCRWKRRALRRSRLVLGAAGHAVGWPLPEGGSQRISDALAGVLRELGGEIETSHPVADLRELPATRATLLDLSVWRAAEVAAARLPSSYRRRLARFPHGPGVFKVDYAIDGPIPWTADECWRAGTVHLGGTLDEVAASERDQARGKVSERPFVLLAQQSLFDSTRAPAGKHTVWAYCHVPRGCQDDRTDAIEAQIERFAPGFRDQILARHSSGPAQLEAINANLVGGDISGGGNDLWHLLARPTLSANPYWMRGEGLYLCSSSTPPGGGVHGMCGHLAARAALSREWR